MPTFKSKNVIKSYKLRLQEKLKTVTEETENATTFLNNCVAEFRNRVQHILEIKDEKCLSLYRKLIRDLENYSEKIFILQASLEEVTEEESSSEDESSTNASKDQQQTSSCISSPIENVSPDLQVEENVNSQTCAELNVQHQTIPKEILSSSENVNHINFEKDYGDAKSNAGEDIKFCSSDHNIDKDDGGSFTEDDFYSLHSDINILNINNNTSVDLPLQRYDNQSILVSDNVSQNSCYCSISSINESLFPINSKSIQSFQIHSFEDNQSSLQKSENVSTIHDIEFQISSCFSATLSHIIDPSDFWIQIENLQGSELKFLKSEYAHLGNLSSIKRGTWCLAPFKSTPFYFRAKSLSDAKSERELVKVIFIDHGSSQKIPLSELRPLPESAYAIPAHAINCFLYGIASANDTWSDESIERFKEFQNYCIETVVKSKENVYGVQLIVKLSSDTFNEDFSVDIAQALCLDGFAISLNESQSCESSQNHQSTSQHLKPGYNKTDSSLEVSGSYDINAISSDSGVSVTSAYKSSQLSNKQDEIFSKVTEEYISSVPTRNAILMDRNINKFDRDLQMQNLMSFESYDALNNSDNLNEEIKTTEKLNSQYCLSCNSDTFCLHLKIPSPTLLFLEKDMVVVMVSHIENLQEFYANMATENIELLDDLREVMTDTYEKKRMQSVRVDALTENMYCAARFKSDNYWYRFKITKISPEDRANEEVWGQYVDYGNTAKVKCMDLRPLTQEFSKHPCFAIKCSLAGVRPVEDSQLNEKPYWSEDAIKVFKDLISFERCLTAQICNELSRDDTYSVLLWDTEDSKDLLINASLADHKVAIFDNSLLHPSLSTKTFVKPSLDTWDPMLEEYVDSHNSYAFNDEDIEMVTTGYHAKDEQYTCKYFSLRGHCPRGENCPFEHLPLLESGITRDQEEVYCLDSTPIISDNIKNILVHVSAIESPLKFYVVMPFGFKSVADIDDLATEGASREEIFGSEYKALEYAMDKHYSSSPFQENTTIALSCGTIVAAKRKWDEKWHRGRVVDVVEIDKPAKIFFVDSGDSEWVPRKFIRTILPQFLYTPFQAVPCSLHGIEPVKSEKGSFWSKDAVKFFEDIVFRQTLLAEIIERFGQQYQVSLRKTQRHDHKSIAELLVKAGYAQFIKVTQQKSNVKEIIYVPG